MKTAKIKKIVKLVFVSVFALLLIIGTSWTVSTCSINTNSEAFTWFISKDDSNGQYYYNNYNESLVVQYINMLNWDVENGGIAKGDSGEHIELAFQTPPVSASDSLNTYFASGDTPDIIDLASADVSPKQLVTEGVLMEITDYVEKYMPNYLAYLKANPDVAKFVREKDDDGKYHYYALYQVADEPNDNFQGFVYRRDWLVKYAEVPSHVWADDIIPDKNDYTSVKQSVASGKIHYTNYYDAQANNDWTGWKVNEVATFTSADGDDPDATYTDNLTFPSGGHDPYYISDWEWMLKTFKGVLGDAKQNSDKDKFALSIYQWGYNGAGDFWSSFGGGHPFWHVDSNNQVKLGANSSTMKGYIECINTWYKEGYVDTIFQTRNQDFWKMNIMGFTSGKVAMGQYGMAYPGTSIRETAKDPDAMVWGCSLPINDLYGEEENKFVIPDACYSAAKLNSRSSTGIAKSAASKNLPALFTMLDYFYSVEGAVLLTFGLNGEQYQALKEHGITGKDYYASYSLTDGTYSVEEVDGQTMYKRIQKISDDSLLQGAANGQRITTTMQINGLIVSTYKHALRHAMDEWRRYYNSTDITNYISFLSIEQSRTYNSAYSFVQTETAKTIPGFVKSGCSDAKWKSYLRQFEINGTDEITELLQSIVDKIG